MRASPGELEKFFWAHVDDDTDSCIVWPYNTSGQGYGRFAVDGRTYRVHVLACERHHGPRPPGMIVTHLAVICHDRRCFNWRHLRWGTYQENYADSISDGTRALGERHGKSKLTWQQVSEIRTRYAAGGVGLQALATEYGTSERTVFRIVHLQTRRSN